MARILFITESLFPSGVTRLLLRVAQALSQHGCEVHVVSFGQIPGSEVAADSDIMFHVCHAPHLQTPFSRDTMKAIAFLRNRVIDLNPDLVHAWCGQSLFVTLAATQLLPRKIGKDLRRFATELRIPPNKNLTRQLLETHFPIRFETIAVPHFAVQENMVENGYARFRFQIIPNSIDPQLEKSYNARSFVLSELGLPDDVMIAGTLAQLLPRNGLKDLMWACDLLTCIRDDVHLLILGSGHQRQRLEQFASLTHARQHIHLLGESDQAVRFLAGIDVYWQSHLHEPMSLDLLTAMAQGIPTVSVSGPGTTELIQHQATGFAVGVGARDEFAKWTKYVIEQPDSAKQLAQQGKDFVRQKYSDSDFVQHYLDLYGR